jgi:hypothetical protein
VFLLVISVIAHKTLKTFLNKWQPFILASHGPLINGLQGGVGLNLKWAQKCSFPSDMDEYNWRTEEDRKETYPDLF